MGFEKKISLIIPVYNKERFIDKCFESVLEQTIDRSLLEVVVVNDGSTDDSLAVCERFAAQNPFLRVIDKPNGGVSSARNAGIRAAKGEYLAFLDADDWLNPCALEKILEVFEHYDDETDVVSYRLVYHKMDGEVSYHKREKWLTKTGLYDLAESPYIAQSTMNVAVRNRPEAPIFFSEELKMGEDQRFVTENLLRRGKLGYCAEAEYSYLRYRGSSASAGNNPLYAFDDMIALYAFFLESAQANPSIAEYCRQILLYNAAWRLKGSKLFPDYCEGQEREEQEARLAAIMRCVPVPSFCKCPYLDRYHRVFLLKRYGLIEEDAQVDITGKKSELGFPSIGYIWKTTPPRLDFMRLIQADDCFQVVARLSCPLFLLDSRVKLEVQIGGMWQELELLASTFDYRACHEKTAKFFITRFNIPFSALAKDACVRFRCTTLQGEEAEHLYVYMDEKVAALRTNSFIRDDAWVFPDYRVRQQDKAIKFIAMDKSYKRKMALSMLKRDRNLLFERMEVKRALRKFEGKAVWVYSDLPTSTAGGNALAQMLHDMKLGDGVERYYVCDLTDELIAKRPELTGKVIKSSGEDFDATLFAASKILASYRERHTFYPEKERFFKFGDLARPKEIVYLQHGILHAHLPWYLGYDRILADRIVVSTTTECEVLLKGYAYTEQSLLKTGAPRLDSLSSDPGNKAKRIVLAPSWRTYLLSGDSQQRIPEDARFLSSAFYRGLVEFVQSLAQSDILTKHGYELDLKLHPNFRCYERHFNFGIPGVNTVFDDIDESLYAVAITDFSSYIYDFIYAGTRVMYFLPDEVEFRAGLNHYRELEISLDDAFGPYANSAEQAVANLDGILSDIENDVPSGYQERIDGLFLHHDGHACDRLYEALRKMGC